MMLTLMSGSEASLAAGTNVYVPALRVWTWAGWAVLFEREFVGSSLVVAAEVVGEDRIRLTLFPRFSSRSGRSIDVTDLRTEVVVPHGETVAIGGLEERGDGLAFALFGVGGGERRGRMLLLVTPYIEAAKPVKAGGAQGE
jgi:type II secretory pathway component GspD/PulD (secretin)